MQCSIIRRITAGSSLVMVHVDRTRLPMFYMLTKPIKDQTNSVTYRQQSVFHNGEMDIYFGAHTFMQGLLQFLSIYA